MSGFDTIVMVDWSGVPDRGAQPKADAIWAGTVRDGQTEPPRYLRSIAVALDWIGTLVEAEFAADRRVLLGFDFPFGYPDGAATLICGEETPDELWKTLSEGLDDLPKEEGRFHLAGRLNERFPGGPGPFWFNGLRSDVPGLPRQKPAMPAGVPEWRAAERAAKGAFSCWQMGGAGAVGSQAMTGMAALWHLRRRFGADLTVWPFETRPAALHVVEIWPSLFRDRVAARMAGADVPNDFRGKPIKDAAQVLATAEAVAEAQADGRLGDWLDAVPEAARVSEGWILGAGQPARHTLAPPPLSNDCFALPPGVEWTPVDDALALLRQRLRPVTGLETVPVEAGDGRVLAADLQARRANPPGANAAVDGWGFAIASTGEGPQHLPLTQGRAAAGAPLRQAVPKGHAVRILTGALLPEGVDTVILEEDSRSDGGAVAFNGPVRPGANTRRAGEDIGAEETALQAGRMLRPQDLALAAAVGVHRLDVRRRLRVGVLSTGDEIVPPGARVEGPERTYDANRPMLLALARRWGHEDVDLGHVRDDRDTLRAALDGAEADVVLTSGGASAGDEDHVSALLRDEGALASWRIALKPGRPLALGMREGVPVFGLPGNPVASFVCALIFARPALSLMAGGPWLEPLAMTLPAAFEKRKKPGRREFLRARLGPDGVETFRSEGSGRITGLSWSDGLVELPDGACRVSRGDPVRYLPYHGFGLA